MVGTKGRNKKNDLGATIVKKYNQQLKSKLARESYLHTTETHVEESKNFSSITEQTSLEEYLTTANLAGSEFDTKRLDLKVVSSLFCGLPNDHELHSMLVEQADNLSILRIPRRPAWDTSTSPEELDKMERESFLNWRRNLSLFQEECRLVLTPYEKNLEYWRQLWRVVERSDVIVQIVDARNPLLFWCSDLDEYVKEVDPKKSLMVLVNKADLLSEPQREIWMDYFNNIGLTAIFWSALQEKTEEEALEDVPSTDDDELSDLEESRNDFDFTKLSHLLIDESNGERVKNKFNTEKSVASDTLVIEEVAEKLIQEDHNDTDDTYSTISNSSDTSRDLEIDKKSVIADNIPHDCVPLVSKVIVGDLDPFGGTSDQDDEYFEDVSEYDYELLPDSDPDGSEDKVVVEFPKDSLTTTTIAFDPFENTIDSNEPFQRKDYPGTADNDEILRVAKSLKLGIAKQKKTEICEQHIDKIEAISNLSKTKPENEPSCNSETCFRLDPVSNSSGDNDAGRSTRTQILSASQLLDVFNDIAARKKSQTIIGLVGYPNVGKSSTINSIIQDKKVAVSSTPGKTKHFQTIKLRDNLMLCDCPGLVFPSFALTKAELVLNGILPVDHMRDHVQPTALLCQQIPRDVLERLYNMNMPRPGEGEDPNRGCTAEELLETYALQRGFVTARGQPDQPRASRHILKDYVKGRLRYCYPPPNTADFPQDFSSVGPMSTAGQKMKTTVAPDPPVNKFDVGFFQTKDVKVFYKGRMRSGIVPLQKGIKKHRNKNKKEKLRRIYGHLDN